MNTEEKATLLAGRSRESNSGSTSPESMIRDSEVDYGFNKRPRVNWKSLIIVIAIVVVAILVLGAVFGIGVAIGRDTAPSRLAPSPIIPNSSNSSCSNNSAASYNWGDYVTIDGERVPVISWFDQVMSTDNIKDNLHKLTEEPHIAGSEENHQLAMMIYKQWEGFMFDKVELVNYSVLLSYPDKADHNQLQIRDTNDQVLYNAKIHQEPPLTPGEDNPDVAAPFNAYSGSGKAAGPLVYVNYARIDDFLYLTNNLSLDLTDHICIARYGQIFRGDKAHLAQRYNCSALLIYSDPQQYAPKGVPVYPDGPSLPPGGVQRGSLMITEGDPLTPGIPAIEGMYRRPYDELRQEGGVPSIPVQPISYGDAIHFMRQLTENPAPSDWFGDLNLTTYYITQNSSNTNKVYIELSNLLEERTIYNVIGTIYGSVEPDRQVIMGNHRDAWVFGAVDPNSGTAVLMEIARTLSVLRKNNWRPGRTLVLCSWDAEEYGLIGSTEWVEEKGRLLGANAVAYLNVDSAVSGSQFFSSAANPLLYEPVWQAAEMVKCPDPKFTSIYDEWMQYSSKNYNGTTKPRIGDLGSGSDFTMFLQGWGISCTSSSYGNTTGYAVYHSVHDNYFWMTNFADPHFVYHQAVGLFWVKVAIMLTTNPLLPYDPRYYALTMEEIFQNLNTEYKDVFKQQNITISYLGDAVSEFSASCVVLWEEVQKLSQQGSLSENTVRIVNDKYMNIERAFIHPEGLPGRSYFRHVIFAPSSVNSYGSSLFPGISDTIFTASQSGKMEDWNNVRRQIDIVRNHLRYATMIMKEPSLMYAPKAQ